MSKDDYEIIIVNDGSKDNSIRIATEYVQKNSNIRIVNRENGGLSAARNTGLSQARGEFVWFVDSDDWIESNCLNSLVSKLEELNLDVLCFGVNYYHNPAHIDKSVSPTGFIGTIMNGAEFGLKGNVIPAAWAAIYRTDFLNQHNLRFYEGILHEDQEFTPRAYFFAGRIMYVHDHIYYYRQREGSIMKSNRDSQRAIDFMKIADSLFDFASANTQKGSEEYYYFRNKINIIVCNSLSFNKNDNPSYSSYKKKRYYPLCIINVKSSKRNKLKYLLVNISPRFYSVITRYIK